MTVLSASFRGGRPRDWSLYLVWGLFVVLVAASVGGFAGSLLFNAVQVAGVGTAVVAIRRYPRTVSRAWWLMALGFVLAAVADLIWIFSPGLRGHSSFITLIGVFFLAKQVLLAAGLVRLVPRGTGHGWPDATLDGAILAAGAAVGLWTFLGRAILHAGPFGSMGTGTALTYVAVDLVVLATLARLLFITGAPRPGGTLLVAAVGTLLVSDGLYCLTLAGNEPAHPSDLSKIGWMACTVLFGAAALHPSVPAIGRPEPVRGGTSAVRVAAFVVFAVVDPVIGALVQFFSRHGGNPSWTDEVIPPLLVMVLSTLLVLRLGLLLRTVNSRAEALQQSLRLQEELQTQLTHRALHDPLTGLGNRALLAERLAGAVDRPFALIMLDLDGFKDINDTLGHPAGDELLVEVAQRLREAVPDDTVVRLGGDEFAVLLPGASRAVAASVARAVLAVIRAPYGVGGRQLYLTTSIGVLVPDGRRRTPGDALRDADTALYAAKAAGKNQVVVFDAALRKVRGEKARLATGLRRALVDDGLHLHYQPIVDLGTGGVHAVEALLRWTPPGRGPVSPGEFVPVAEETGLIVPIGGWVLDKALRQGRQWFERHGTAMSVNVSALQLSAPDFADRVLEALRVSGMPGKGLILELTESVLITQVTGDDQGVQDCLGRLRQHGVRVAVDDFGTGYSSLSYLWQLPVDVLKIDRMFTGYVSGPEHQESRRAAFLRAILDVGRSLQLQTIAEGVEQPEEARRLRGMGCRYVQGYLFAAPLPAVAVSEYLDRPARLHSA
jgi:diguanylate cyclase (GGDEF)-like protein